jgi:hypothetical protein
MMRMHTSSCSGVHRLIRKRNYMQSDTPRKRGKPFEAGNKGRAAGSRNKVTLALEQLLEGDAPAITRKMIQLAKKGDPTSIRLCMDRVYPVRRERQLKLTCRRSILPMTSPLRFGLLFSHWPMATLPRIRPSV